LKHTAVLIVVFSFLLASSLSAQETYTKLATFECFYGQCQPGLPFSGLVETSPGTFFGSLTFGMLYTVSETSGLQTIYSLPSQYFADAYSPIQASDGYLYIPSAIGDQGVVFKYQIGGTPTQITVPVNVGVTPLIEAPNLTLYGSSTPANQASPIFRLTLQGDVDIIGTAPENLNSVQTLLLASNGLIYGLTGSFVGGGEGQSSLIRVGYDGAVHTISTFGGQNGFLIEASDGNFYGCGGNSIYRLTKWGKFTTIHTFRGGLQGSSVSGCPIEASDGNLYGTTYNGGANGYGTIFRSTLSGEVTTVYSFTGSDNEQRTAQYYPELIEGSDGKLYGATTGPFANSPGTFVGGTIFNLDLGLPKPKPILWRTSPLAGDAGESVLLIGRNFLGATSVSFNGTPATFRVKAGSYIEADVPPGATSGPVTVVTPNGTTTSWFPFHVN
jgi:uncharacterized repeat protein (TIGR03803 family)